MEAIIFDMDGLLIDSEPLWREAEQEHFGKVGLHLAEEDCLKTTGLRVEEVVAYWYSRHPWKKIPPERIVEDILNGVITRVSTEGVLKEGVHEVLTFVSSLGLPVGLASSSPYVLIDAVLDTFQLRRYFQVINSAEGEAYGKPHPQVYLKAAAMLDVRPTGCLALEDSLNGVIAAKAARMKCIAIPEGPMRAEPRFILADVVLNSLLDFTPAVWQKLNGTEH